MMLSSKIMRFSSSPGSIQIADQLKEQEEENQWKKKTLMNQPGESAY